MRQKGEERNELRRKKDMEHTRKWYRPTRGWAMRTKTSVSYKSLVRQVDWANQSWDV